MIFSNMTVEEALKLATDAELRAFLEDKADVIDSQEKRHASEIKALERAIELTDEQVYFARQLLDELEESLRHAKSGKHAREIFQHVVSEGYFER